MATMLTLKEVSERLGLHINTVRRYVNKGMIPIVKFERAIRIEERDLEKFIKARKQAATKKKSGDTKEET